MFDRQYAERLADMLRRAYWATHNEQELLGVPDDDQSVVLQHLRLRILPAYHLAENFEAHLQRSLEIGPTDVPVYHQDQLRLQRLSRVQRARLFKQLLASEGQQWRGGRWVANTEGWGEIEVFVYDSRTGKYIIRSGIGTHFAAVMTLYDIVRPNELGHHWPLPPADRKRDALTRMESGIIGFIVRLAGWRTPFLHPWEKEPGLSVELWHENIRQVCGLQLFLVVHHSGEPVSLS